MNKIKNFYHQHKTIMAFVAGGIGVAVVAKKHIDDLNAQRHDGKIAEKMLVGIVGAAIKVNESTVGTKNADLYLGLTSSEIDDVALGRTIDVDGKNNVMFHITGELLEEK